MDHEIKTEKNSETTLRPLYQLFRVELEAIKYYFRVFCVEERQRQLVTIWSWLVFIKEKENPSRVVVDYPGLNEIPKQINAPLPFLDHTFDISDDAEAVFNLRSHIWILLNKRYFQSHQKGFLEYLVIPTGFSDASALNKFL